MRVPLVAPFALAAAALVGLTAAPAQADPAPVPACAGALPTVPPPVDPTDAAAQATLVRAVTLINDRTDRTLTPVCIHTLLRMIVVGVNTVISLNGSENGIEGLYTLEVWERPWEGYFRVIMTHRANVITVVE
ncbi:hypothetical protein [Kitasatospora purpeofusca]|uniref:hypothetical protein n=1 Tax=Kitasatospora purpeofusca TaxID=67352 RepID=UPI00364C5901